MIRIDFCWITEQGSQRNYLDLVQRTWNLELSEFSIIYDVNSYSRLHEL
jgi:hypothetical protein